MARVPIKEWHGKVYLYSPLSRLPSPRGLDVPHSNERYRLQYPTIKPGLDKGTFSKPLVGERGKKRWGTPGACLLGGQWLLGRWQGMADANNNAISKLVGRSIRKHFLRRWFSSHF